MKTADPYAVVLVTAPDLGTARRLARSALEARLVACANLVPSVESHYWWQGRIESGTEVLLLFKTCRDRVSALERLILAEHPYDTPEFLVVPLRGGTAKYLAWISASLGPGLPPRATVVRRRSAPTPHTP